MDAARELSEAVPTAVLLALPWFLFGAYLAARLRFPRPLPPPDPDALGGLPFVSVIVPARNEADNIESCLASLKASRYPDFEIVVVDDRSDDGTGEIARSVAPGRARRIAVIDGQPLPPGWFGKPWACHQGAAHAGGDLLLFTDADTRHAPDLLERAVAGLFEDRADALSLVGRQVLGTFWERVIQPQMFFLLALRYPDLRSPCRPERWRDAIANGQFILVRRDVYEDLGGHEAVSGEVVEDLRLAQILCRMERTLTIRAAEDALATRMYSSLHDVVAGWSKNVAMGARQSTGPVLGRVAVPGIVFQLLVFWVLPAAVGAAALAGAGGEGVGLWAALTFGCGLVLWSAVSRRFGAPLAYGALHPLGALAAASIVLLSWKRGSRIEWKGRWYEGSP